MINYKGVFYNEEKDKKFYEGGAHFKYIDLVKRLIDLIKEKNLELDNSNILNENLFGSNIKIIKKDFSSKLIIKEKLLSINNIKNNLKTNNSNKYILNTEKNLEKENIKKKGINELFNNNIKLSPFKNNFKNRKLFCVNSVDKNYTNRILKTSGNNDDINDEKNVLYLNIFNKKMENNNLPVIHSLYFNNLSNRNIFPNHKNNNIKLNLKQIYKLPLNNAKIAKNNLFLKNKALSPDKNIDSLRSNIFKKDFTEQNKNFESIEVLTKSNNNFNYEKFSKNLIHNMSIPKKKFNINFIHFSLNKK